MATDWPPLKGASFQVGFPLYDGSGCLVGAGAGLAACVSTDFGAFGAATCVVSELNSGAGVYTLKLSTTEMNGDVVIWKAISTSASARPAIGVLHTAASRQIKDLAWPTTTGRSLDVDAAGGVEVGAFQASAITASAFIAGAIDNSAFNVSETLNATVLSMNASVIGASQLAANAIDNAAFNVTETLTANPAASGLTASSFQTGAVDAVSFAQGAADKIWSSATRTLTSLGASMITASTFQTGAVDNVAFNVTETLNAAAVSVAASAIGASQFGTGAIDAVAFAQGAADRIWSSAARTLTSLGASTITASTFQTAAIDNVAFNVTETLNAAVVSMSASVIGASQIAANAIDAAAIAASAIGVSEFADSAAQYIGRAVRTGCALAEQGVGAPPATPNLEQALDYLYMNWRNSASTTSGCIMITNDAGTVIAKSAISDSGSTFTKGEFVSG